MAAGGPVDHPLTDVINYDIETYGKEVDDLLKKLSSLMSIRELREWWENEIGWECKPETALLKIQDQYFIAQERAKNSGWEIP